MKIASAVAQSLSLLIPLALSSACFAQAASQHIFKCIDGEMIAYQSMPCAGTATEARVLTIARAEPPAQSVTIPQPPAVPTAQSPGRVWPPRRTLMLGMSDDEVLNLAGWGVPKRITRTRAPRGWQEEWTYPTGNGERRLRFVNATLVDAQLDVPAAQQIAIDRSAGYPPT